MGAGIAAHAANAGCQVLLLDIVKEGGDRSAIANAAIKQMAKSNPEMLTHPRNASLISAGNIEDDLDKLSEVDWVIEVIVENLGIKRSLYASMAEHIGPETIVSSNTSTLPRAELVEGMPSDMTSRFLITHFFNPPRYLPLLEVVTSSEVSDSVTERLCSFADERLGKRVIMCNDTPGFIGNRLGVYFIQRAFKATIDHGFTIEQADAMLGRPLGIPKTAVFGLMDLVGIDLSVHVIESLVSHLPEDDPFHDIVGTGEEIIQAMIEEGYTGRKGLGGFYRLNKEGGKRVKEARNLATGGYAPANRKAAFPSAKMGKQGLGPLMDYPDEGAAFVSDILLDSLSYAAHLVPDVTDDIYSIDSAMKAGFNWKAGPFQMMDSVGVASMVERLEASGRSVPDFLRTAVDRGWGDSEARTGRFHGHCRKARIDPDSRRPQAQGQAAQTQRLCKPLGYGRWSPAGRVPLEDERGGPIHRGDAGRRGRSRRVRGLEGNSDRERRPKLLRRGKPRAGIIRGQPSRVEGRR